MVTPPSADDNLHAGSVQKHVTPFTVAVDLVLCAVFFFFIFSLVQGHVHSTASKFILFFSASTAMCVTGVLWMAIQMFRIVVAGEKTLKAERARK